MNEFQISTNETKKKLDAKKILLIDVREPYEHEIAKIDGSILIPMEEVPAIVERKSKLAANKEVIFNCIPLYGEKPVVS